MFNILIVEDDNELRHLFQRVLEQNGYYVKGVENGKRRLQRWKNPYDHGKKTPLTICAEDFSRVRTITW